MEQKTYNISIAAYLTILIPLPGRFVFGITLFIELLLLTAVGTAIHSLIKKLQLTEIKSFLTMLTIISFSILYRQLLVLCYPEIALTLGYYMFLPTVSLLLLHYLFEETDNKILIRLKNNGWRMLIFTLFGLIFCLLRDIAGYGTFTFFGKNHQILEIVLFNGQKPRLLSFIASIPGALTFSGLILFIHLILKTKLQILKNAEVNNVVR